MTLMLTWMICFLMRMTATQVKDELNRAFRLVFSFPPLQNGIFRI